MQAFGRNLISVTRFRFASDGIFDRFQVSARLGGLKPSVSDNML